MGDEAAKSLIATNEHVTLDGEAIFVDVVELKQNVDEVWIDKMGNVLGIKKGTDPNGLRIMIDAHMDEVGLIISFIEKNGFLRFSPLGGIDKRLYPGSDIKIQTKNGKLVSGIIGMNPPHITDPKLRDKSPNFLDLFIDIRKYTFQCFTIGKQVSIVIYKNRYLEMIFKNSFQWVIPI